MFSLPWFSGGGFSEILIYSIVIILDVWGSMHTAEYRTIEFKWTQSSLFLFGWLLLAISTKSIWGYWQMHPEIYSQYIASGFSGDIWMKLPERDRVFIHMSLIVFCCHTTMTSFGWRFFSKSQKRLYDENPVAYRKRVDLLYRGNEVAEK